MSDKEDKIKIKVAIAKLKKKNALYKAYCKSNKIKIKGSKVSPNRWTENR